MFEQGLIALLVALNGAILVPPSFLQAIYVPQFFIIN